MKKNKIVINRKIGNGVKVLTNPMLPARFINDKNAAIDPDMRHLKGIPLEHLTVVNGIVQKSMINKLISPITIPIEVKAKRAFKAKRKRLFVDIIILAVVFYLFKNHERIIESVLNLF